MQFGLGLRAQHYQEIIESKPKLDWFEIISEDFLVAGGSPCYYLDKIRQDYPLSMHGVSLSIGSVDELNWNYLNQLKALDERIQPLWISDHLCWTGVKGINTHDLLPLPYTEEAVQHVVQRIKKVQDFLGRQLVLENVSSYVTYADSELSELEFLLEVVQRSDCLILLDINNIYVSAFNHGFNALTYLNSIPIDRVKQFHLAGHKPLQAYLIDTHGETITKEVWDLYTQALVRFGTVATLIERDENIPPLTELLEELNFAKQLADQMITAGELICT